MRAWCGVEWSRCGASSVPHLYFVSKQTGLKGTVVLRYDGYYTLIHYFLPFLVRLSLLFLDHKRKPAPASGGCLDPPVPSNSLLHSIFIESRGATKIKTIVGRSVPVPYVPSFVRCPAFARLSLRFYPVEYVLWRTSVRVISMTTIPSLMSKNLAVRVMLC